MRVPGTTPPLIQTQSEVSYFLIAPLDHFIVNTDRANKRLTESVSGAILDTAGSLCDPISPVDWVQ